MCSLLIILFSSISTDRKTDYLIFDICGLTLVVVVVSTCLLLSACGALLINSIYIKSLLVSLVIDVNALIMKNYLLCCVCLLSGLQYHHPGVGDIFSLHSNVSFSSA
jgi:hypothetical protein